MMTLVRDGEMERNSKKQNEIFSVGVEGVDSAGLVQELARRSQARSPFPAPDWPKFAVELNALPADRLSPDLALALEQSWQKYDQIWVEAETLQTRFAITRRIKQLFHQLFVFYVNKLGRKQVDYNEQILRTIQELVKINLAQQERIAALEKRLLNDEQTSSEEDPG